MLAAEMGFSMKVCFTPACAGEVPGHSCPPPQRVFHELCAFSFSSWPLFAMCSKAAPAQRFPWLRPPDHRQNRLFSFLNLFFLETASVPQTHKHCLKLTSASSSIKDLHSLKQHMIQQGLLVGS